VLHDFGIDLEAELPRLLALRQDVRKFLEEQRSQGGYTRTPAGWDRFDPELSRKIGAKGWIGMSWPKAYGGGDRTALERYVATEELLAAGAPVRAHWLADRQIGPLLLRHGTEAQRQTFLPRIAAGVCFICAGFSEPDSGSDLASIRTKAEKIDGGWRINGTKVWTSYAHRVHFINLFARTSQRTEDRHTGVSQFLVDMTVPGITVRPILNLASEHDFNQIAADPNVGSIRTGSWSRCWLGLR
jgi:acyl-CoA dehydrogenase